MAGTMLKTAERTEGVVRRYQITCTGDASDGSFPATTLKALGCFIDGTIVAVRTNPGAVAPTDNIDFTLIDADGIDRFSGLVLNRDTADSESVRINALVSLDEELTLTLVGNVVNEAVVVIELIWVAAAIDTPPWLFDGERQLLVSDESAQDVLAEVSNHLAGRIVRKTWTPTMDTSAYVTGDNLYTTIAELTECVRESGGSGRIVAFWMDDGDLQSQPFEGHFFQSTVTIPAANAAWSISDADNKLHACSPIPSGLWFASALNSRGDAIGASYPFVCAEGSTSLFVAVVTRGAPTHTASGVTFGVLIEQD